MYGCLLGLYDGTKHFMLTFFIISDTSVQFRIIYSELYGHRIIFHNSLYWSLDLDLRVILVYF